MDDKEIIMKFLRERYNKPHMREDVLVCKIVKDSISFVTLLSEIETVIDKEILLEKIEDISKLTVGDICRYV